MMNRIEMVNNKIEELENNDMVIVNVIANGEAVSIEMATEEELAIATGLEVVTVEAYEENGYDVEGLATETIEF